MQKMEHLEADYTKKLAVLEEQQKSNSDLVVVLVSKWVVLVSKWVVLVSKWVFLERFTLANCNRALLLLLLMLKLVDGKGNICSHSAFPFPPHPIAWI
jgi:hypothetical protein